MCNEPHLHMAMHHRLKFVSFYIPHFFQFCSDNFISYVVHLQHVFLVIPFFCIKKALLSEKFLFQGREHQLRVTTLNSLIAQDISLINYGREMIHR